MSAKQGCPACGERGYSIFLEIPDVPVHVGVVWETADAARACPRGDMRLGFCRCCGFIHNTAFDGANVDYGLRYDNALHFSGVFQQYEQRLAEHLVERYGIRGKRVLEIGCGRGHFLGLLCRLGDNRGIGFDPSYDARNADPAVGDTVRVVKGFYSPSYAHEPADLLCCRHVLEHIGDPRSFLLSLRDTLDDQQGAVLYFEVPNAFLALRDLSIWDLIYEHAVYFVPNSIDFLFRACGFEVLDFREAYSGQFISLEARLRRDGAVTSEVLPTPTPNLERDVAAYAEHFRRRKDEWLRRLDAYVERGRSVAVWGAGAKAVSFLNLLEAGSRVARVVDINPGKQGSYLAGSGHEIVAPEALATMPPDVVIVMNPVYKAEVEAALAALDLAPEVLTT